MWDDDRLAKWLAIATLVLAAVAVSLSVFLSYLNLDDRVTASDQQCAREVNARYSELRDARDAATGDQVDLIAVAIVERQPIDPAALGAAVDARAKAKRELKALGPYPDRVARVCGG